MTPKRVQNRSQNHPEALKKGNRKNIGNSTLISIEAVGCKSTGLDAPPLTNPPVTAELESVQLSLRLLQAESALSVTWIGGGDGKRKSFFV